ncbi:MAG: ketoacyl-ACP synthase III [Bacteroidales bacterium]|nr:ketoacyl-ACP synthase III [Bacteroidales bacterium]
MAFLEVKNVSIQGISACVPQNVVDNALDYPRKWSGYESFVSATGIARHRNSPETICSSDHCQTAAEQIIAGLGWDKKEIEALVFVSQTPDFYNVPATSCLLQERLGLSSNCYTLDIALGCSGWVYALSVISSLMQSGSIKRGLLLAGDTPTKFCSKEDKSTFPLFGDAGTATALEFSEGAEPIRFSLQTDGSGYKTIIINAGGYRKPVSNESLVMKDHGEGKKRCDLNLEMDGEDVFMFGISRAPKAVKSLAEHFGTDLGAIDLFTFHQANLFMNEKIRNKLKIDAAKVPYSIQEYGNTSCASIPLTLVTRCAEQLKAGKVQHIACGFGVGLSWGAVNFVTDSIVVPSITEL